MQFNIFSSHSFLLVGPANIKTEKGAWPLYHAQVLLSSGIPLTYWESAGNVPLHQKPILFSLHHRDLDALFPGKLGSLLIPCIRMAGHT